MRDKTNANVFLHLWNGFRGLTEAEANEAEKPGTVEYVLGPFRCVQITYGCDIKCWPLVGQDDEIENIPISKDGWIEYSDALYGDAAVTAWNPEEKGGV